MIMVPQRPTYSKEAVERHNDCKETSSRAAGLFRTLPWKGVGENDASSGILTPRFTLRKPSQAQNTQPLSVLSTKEPLVSVLHKKLETEDIIKVREVTSISFSRKRHLAVLLTSAVPRADAALQF